MIIKKIVNLATVNFIHRNCYCKITLMVFPVVNTSIKKIFDGDILQTIHRISLSWASLTISKDSYDTLIENKIQNWSDLEKVKLFIGLIVSKRIVKFELSIVNHFCDTIDLVFTVMNYDLWIWHRYNVDFTISQFIMKNGSLFETYRNFHLISKTVYLSWRNSAFFIFNHSLELDINFDALKLIVGFSFTL